MHNVTRCMSDCYMFTLTRVPNSSISGCGVYLEYSGFQSKMGVRFGIESMHEMRIPKITTEITGLRENLGRDFGIKEPNWRSSSTLTKT